MEAAWGSDLISGGKCFEAFTQQQTGLEKKKISFINGKKSPNAKPVIVIITKILVYSPRQLRFL